MATQNYKEEIIEFIDKSYGNRQKRKAFRINDYLCCAYCSSDYKSHVAKIYKIIQGTPFCDVVFADIKDAVEMAKIIVSAFGEYMPIWNEYPDADVISLAKWSTKNGIQLYETLRLLNSNKNITLNDIKQMYQEAGESVSNWTRDFR